jgi:hypothetical protein
MPDKGSIQLSRVKDIGEDFSRGYKIYVGFQALKALWTKRDIIQETMLAVTKGEVDSPHNIPLHNSQVVRISHFYDKIYYGLHQVDELSGVPKVGKGMNLSEEEFELLLEYVEERVSACTPPPTLSSSSSKRHMYTPTNGEEASSSKKKYRKRVVSFPTTMYSWVWEDDTEDENDNDREVGGEWHFSPKSCFREAMLHKPDEEEGDEEGELPIQYKMRTITKIVPITVDDEMLDVVCGFLLKQDIDSTYAQPPYTPTKSKSVVESSEIYDCVKKVVNKFRKMNEQDEIHLMEKIAIYERKVEVISPYSNDESVQLLIKLLNFVFEE